MHLSKSYSYVHCALALLKILIQPIVICTHDENINPEYV